MVRKVMDLDGACGGGFQKVEEGARAVSARMTTLEGCAAGRDFSNDKAFRQ